MSTTIRISRHTSHILHLLSAQVEKSMQEILDEAIEGYRRQIFFHETNKAYTALRKDPKLWKNELKERESWDISLFDDIEA
ncbi:MAG: toxin-antitoxin system protein [Chlamydiae bacterium]|nr:toxin-antitoxin system protein [Chlamydiota bacterium]MBI3276506.1 toxin-antitoxin system protein [Chlamydiota bacterium]